LKRFQTESAGTGGGGATRVIRYSLGSAVARDNVGSLPVIAQSEAEARMSHCAGTWFIWSTRLLLDWTHCSWLAVGTRPCRFPTSSPEIHLYEREQFPAGLLSQPQLVSFNSPERVETPSNPPPRRAERHREFGANSRSKGWEPTGVNCLGN